MPKPFIYAAADDRYWHIYGKAFLNSARAHGHEAEVFRLGIMADTMEQKAHCATERFRLMPEMVRRHGAALAVDVDAIIRGPVEIERECDLGVFIRPNMPHLHKVAVGNVELNVCAKALAGIFYCTERGLEFAEAVASALSARLQWGDDQAALWATYQRLGSKLRIKLFDKRHMNWAPGSTAPIYAAKGRSKAGDEFLKEVEHWKRHSTI